MIRVVALLGVIALLLANSGCTSVVEHTGVALFYWKAKLPDNQVRLDIPYRENSTLPKHRLDLYLPTGTNWPILIFIHGGGWTKGDKNMVAGGADVYANIGRFYAAHGIGVAVINYPLQPEANWRQQLDDVATATEWVHSHIEKYGGDPHRLFVSGHSAGAQLTARIALDQDLQKQHGLSSSDIAGAIIVSGAALDLTDEKTYELGASRSKYEDRFSAKVDPDWKKAASPVSFVSPNAPPFLIFYGGNEKASLKRQAVCLTQALSADGIKNNAISVPRQGHEQMALCMSRIDKIVGPAIIDFIKSTTTRSTNASF